MPQVLKNYTVKELKKKCKRKGIKGYSAMNKRTLISRLRKKTRRSNMGKFRLRNLFGRLATKADQWTMMRRRVCDTDINFCSTMSASFLSNYIALASRMKRIRNAPPPYNMRLMTEDDFIYIHAYTNNWDRYLNLLARGQDIPVAMVTQHRKQIGGIGSHMLCALGNRGNGRTAVELTEKFMKEDASIVSAKKLLSLSEGASLEELKRKYTTQNLIPATRRLAHQLYKVSKKTFPTTQEMVVFRGETTPKTHQWKKGDTFIRNGFVSTTGDWDTAIVNFGIRGLHNPERPDVTPATHKVTFFEIIIPKGKQVILPSLCTIQEEYEAILPSDWTSSRGRFLDQHFVIESVRPYIPEKEEWVGGGRGTGSDEDTENIKKIGGVERVRCIWMGAK